MRAVASRMRWLSLLAVVIVGDAGAADGGLPLAPTRVDVTLSDSRIDMPAALPPGAVTFHVVNDGLEKHGLVVADTVRERKLAHALGHGESADMTVYLQPGIYAAYSPVGNDRQRGMERRLTVKPALRLPVR